MDKPRFQVGRAAHPRAADPSFDDYIDAETDAITRSLVEDVWAVWGAHAEVLALAFEGTVFRP